MHWRGAYTVELRCNNKVAADQELEVDTEGFVLRKLEFTVMVVHCKIIFSSDHLLLGPLGAWTRPSWLAETATASPPTSWPERWASSARCRPPTMLGSPTASAAADCCPPGAGGCAGGWRRAPASGRPSPDSLGAGTWRPCCTTSTGTPACHQTSLFIVAATMPHLGSLKKLLSKFRLVNGVKNRSRS